LGNEFLAWLQEGKYEYKVPARLLEIWTQSIMQPIACQFEMRFDVRVMRIELALTSASNVAGTAASETCCAPLQARKASLAAENR
jgi:hypothetical protein